MWSTCGGIWADGLMIGHTENLQNYISFALKLNICGWIGCVRSGFQPHRTPHRSQLATSSSARSQGLKGRGGRLQISALRKYAYEELLLRKGEFRNKWNMAAGFFLVWVTHQIALFKTHKANIFRVTMRHASSGVALHASNSAALRAISSMIFSSPSSVNEAFWVWPWWPKIGKHRNDFKLIRWW